MIASPAVRDGVVYAATSDSGLFLALDAKTGAQTFSVGFHHWPMFSSPALVDGGFAYIGSEQGKLLAIDLKNRRAAWEFQTDVSKRLLPAYSNPDGSVNYYAVQAGNFYDDIVVAQDKLMNLGQVHSSPVLAGNLLVFGATDGNVYALQSSG